MRELNKIMKNKAIIVIVVISVILLAGIVILEHYGVSFNITVNFNSTTIVALATLALAFFGYRSVREMKKQRESAYMPELILKKSNALQIDYKTFDLHRKSNLDIECYNIGLASAKYIAIKWNIKYSEFLDKFKKMDMKDIDLCINDDSISLSYPSSHTSSRKWHKTMSTEMVFSRCLYCLPIDVNKTPLYLSIPETYLYLLSLLLYLNLYENNIGTLETPPDIHLNLEYQDIGNNTHIKEFLVRFKITTHISIGEKGEKKTAEAIAMPIEIQLS